MADSGKRMAVGLSRFPGNVFAGVSVVDAATAVNKCNSDDSSGYFCTVVNSVLCPLDQTNQDGSVKKYISVAKHIIGSTKVCIGIV